MTIKAKKAPAARRLAVVLAGAGARGAYEAGVLSVVLPQLERAGIAPKVFVGTSAGAINAVLFTAYADLPAEEQAEKVLDVWRGIGPGDVFRPLARSAPQSLGRWAGQRLQLPGARLDGVLDTTPLRRTAERVVDWERMRANLDDGQVEALAVVATSARTGRTMVFVDEPSHSAPLSPDDSRPMDYVRTPIAASHVLASAAIPVAFPPVWVEAPSSASGWYADGGVRLNAPLKPSLALRADALIVVATHPCEYPAVPTHSPDEGPPPDVDDAVVQLMDAAMVDPMVEDVRTLNKINQLVGNGAQRHQSKRPFEVVPYMFFGPQHRGALASEATLAYEQEFGGLSGAVRALRRPDLPILARLFGGDGPRRGDLLSYLLFDPGFVDRASELGRQDALRVLEASGSNGLPWTTGSAEDDQAEDD
jgi:NTE family protein